MENTKLKEIASPSEIASVLQTDEGIQALEYILKSGTFNDGKSILINLIAICL